MMWVGMFKRMIINYETFAKQLIQFFGSQNLRRLHYFLWLCLNQYAVAEQS